PALDEHGHGLLHLVADHAPLEGAGEGFPRHGGVRFGVHLAEAFSLSTVRTRAMSRRVRESWLVLFNCWVPCCMRNEKCALSNSPSSLFSASTSLARNSFAFIWTSCRPPGSSRDGHARDNDGAQRQLGRGEPEGLAGEFFTDSVHFVEHLARLDFGDIELGIPLALAHPDFGRLLGDRLVREDADPDPAATLDVAGHGAARGLDLASRQPAPADGLQSVLAEGDHGATGRETLVAALL